MGIIRALIGVFIRKEMRVSICMRFKVTNADPSSSARRYNNIILYRPRAARKDVILFQKKGKHKRRNRNSMDSHHPRDSGKVLQVSWLAALAECAPVNIHCVSPNREIKYDSRYSNNYRQIPFFRILCELLKISVLSRVYAECTALRISIFRRVFP